MEEGALLIRAARILDPTQGLDKVGDILVRQSHIEALGDLDGSSVPPDCRVVQGQGLVATPGFIDLHAHLREPGYEEKETIASGTRAAARGGFTTLCCMPNTSPPMDTAAVVELVLRKTQAEGTVRVLPIGCVSKGRQGRELAELAELAQAGCVAFSDDGSPVADAHLMRLALTYTLGLSVPVMDHCEEPSLSAGGVMHQGWVATRLGLRGIPAAAEESIAARDIALAELTGGRVHLCHVSTAGTVELVRRAKERGLSITAEATPHHLTLTDAWVEGQQGDGRAPVSPAAYDTAAKVNPPLRGPEDVAALVEGLREGVIDCIATDHAPHEVTAKLVTFEEAAFGISGLETALGLALKLVHGGSLELPVLVERLTLGPARVLGERFLELVTLRPSTPADITLFDPGEEWAVDINNFASKGKNTPLEGVTLKGRVRYTIVGGRVVYESKAEAAQGVA
ncbi:MAG: dihydroorotase [Dehalococcoidia bacterium]